MSPLWRHITHIEGMTVSRLVAASGMSKAEVRAELLALGKDGRTVRERAPIGKEHLWWRAGSQPLDDIDVMLVMALAERIHRAPGKLRSIIQHLSTRVTKETTRSLQLCSTANPKVIHRVIRDILDLYMEKNEGAMNAAAERELKAA